MTTKANRSLDYAMDQPQAGAQGFAPTGQHDFGSNSFMAAQLGNVEQVMDADDEPPGLYDFLDVLTTDFMGIVDPLRTFTSDSMTASQGGFRAEGAFYKLALDKISLLSGMLVTAMLDFPATDQRYAWILLEALGRWKSIFEALSRQAQKTSDDEETLGALNGTIATIRASLGELPEEAVGDLLKSAWSDALDELSLFVETVPTLREVLSSGGTVPEDTQVGMLYLQTLHRQASILTTYDVEDRYNLPDLDAEKHRKKKAYRAQPTGKTQEVYRSDRTGIDPEQHKAEGQLAIEQQTSMGAALMSFVEHQAQVPEYKAQLAELRAGAFRSEAEVIDAFTRRLGAGETSKKYKAEVNKLAREEWQVHRAGQAVRRAKAHNESANTKLRDAHSEVFAGEFDMDSAVDNANSREDNTVGQEAGSAPMDGREVDQDEPVDRELLSEQELEFLEKDQLGADLALLIAGRYRDRAQVAADRAKHALASADLDLAHAAQASVEARTHIASARLLAEKVKPELHGSLVTWADGLERDLDDVDARLSTEEATRLVLEGARAKIQASVDRLQDRIDEYDPERLKVETPELPGDASAEVFAIESIKVKLSGKVPGLRFLTWTGEATGSMAQGADGVKQEIGLKFKLGIQADLFKKTFYAAVSASGEVTLIRNEEMELTEFIQRSLGELARWIWANQLTSDWRRNVNACFTRSKEEVEGHFDDLLDDLEQADDPESVAKILQAGLPLDQVEASFGDGLNEAFGKKMEVKSAETQAHVASVVQAANTNDALTWLASGNPTRERAMDIVRSMRSRAVERHAEGMLRDGEGYENDPGVSFKTQVTVTGCVGVNFSENAKAEAGGEVSWQGSDGTEDTLDPNAEASSWVTGQLTHRAAKIEAKYNPTENRVKLTIVYPAGGAPTHDAAGLQALLKAKPGRLTQPSAWLATINQIADYEMANVSKDDGRTDTIEVDIDATWEDGTLSAFSSKLRLVEAHSKKLPSWGRAGVEIETRVGIEGRYEMGE